jgi:hypothetical protein
MFKVLLRSAKLLLSNENSHQFALGLYMYAIEEYGKYPFIGWIFGR